MVHALSLFVFLCTLWLALSGHYTGLLLGLGLGSSLFAVLIARRMDLVDHEGSPVHLAGRTFRYGPWLIGQIVKANLDVARRILCPGLPISPTVVRVPTSQRTRLGRVIHANSITLTPGTVSIDVGPGTIEVHALTREAAEDLLKGEMDRRVTAMEGRI
jgi:multicomponent Na+:H+ antiporter subunit E